MGEKREEEETIKKVARCDSRSRGVNISLSLVYYFVTDVKR